ncbi:ABC transporter permease [Ohtaekwangia koreensis]|uniref:Putative ABC transport system permease protein n=1 Tax=Ohtaekwangia koreensis TaxID=688867 RepID=A0A1T5MM51_9BACT|nr:ABC transporter permease [Ohtaekwangia koreensis]SKC89310.1 putative ABC transport system permease protein [Ohtaekwangia koreensis]
MIKNYIKVALRSIFRNKLTAFINIAGLALAIASAILIFLFVTDEISYDKYHTKAERIYRVTRSFHSQEGEVSLRLANVAPPIGPLLKNDFGELEVMARTINFGTVIGLEENGELKISNSEDNVFVAEPNIFRIFDIDIKSGDPLKAIERPFTVMLSEKAAKKYFNSENIIGKRLRANNAFDLEVTGVYKDFPKQSHWHPEFLISFSTLENDNIYGRRQLETNWGNNSFGTYILLEKGADPKKTEAAFPAFLDKHFGNYARANWGVPADWVASKSTTLSLQKLTDIHLRSHLDDELETNGDINSVYMMSVIGLFIILIACFNFINLSTARATKRAKEVGLRKVVGAFKTQLVGQYLSESILITFFSLILALFLSVRGILWLNEFTGKEISMNIFSNIALIGGLIVFALVIGVLAGIYPAFVISSFNPALALKGQQGSATGKSAIRKTLVIVQFSISIVLIIATLITFQQLAFLNNRDLGYKKDQVVTLSYYEDLNNTYDAFHHALTQSSLIQNVGRSSRIPTGRLLDSYGDASVMKGDSLVSIPMNLKSISTDEDFFDTYSIQVAAGRNFSKAIPTDDSLAFIINEAAAKAIGWTNVEQNIDKDFHYADVQGKLIGVVKDFHFESLHQQIVPMIFLMRRDNYNRLSVKIAGNSLREGLAHLEKTWESFLPGRPFEYEFLSDRYRKLYEAEQKQSQLFTTFAALAIFIASLGLFGLATFSTLQRMKEIGIRKILGASVGSILQLLSKEILILVAIANLVAWPIAWYSMSRWLDTFAYRVDMNPAIFVAGAACAILIALVTVSTQTIRAALGNPAKTLRYE